MTRSAIEGPSSVNPEKCCIVLALKKFRKLEFYHSDPLSLSILSGDSFDVDRFFEKSSVILLLVFLKVYNTNNQKSYLSPQIYT